MIIQAEARLQGSKRASRSPSRVPRAMLLCPIWRKQKRGWH